MTDSFDNDGSMRGGDEVRVLREEAAALERNARSLENIAHEEEERAHDFEKRAHEIEDLLEHDHRGGDNCHDADVKITVVVNGQPTVVEAPKTELLGDVRQKALEQTKNLAQPAENWEIKTEAGEVLDPNKKVGEYSFGHEATLFLSLSAGVAGA